jgi:hypothetical protein
VNAAAPANVSAAPKTDPAANGNGDQSPPGKTAMLTPPAEPSPPSGALPKPSDTLSGGPLVEAIKNELKRVGCYSGAIDDNWTNSETKSSLRKFAKYAKLSAPDVPAADFLDALRSKSGRICPLECSPREVERNGQCIAKTCPGGTVLGDDGSCSKPEKKIATHTDAGAPAAAVTTAPPGYDPYDRARRITPGGLETCGPAGCEKVPAGCYAVRGMQGGHNLGGKIICGEPVPTAQTGPQFGRRQRGGYAVDGSRRGYGPGPSPEPAVSAAAAGYAGCRPIYRGANSSGIHRLPSGECGY